MVEAVHIAYGNDLYEVFIARFVFRKQHEVIELRRFTPDALFDKHILAHINFAAYYGLYLKFPAVLEELERIGFRVGKAHGSLYELERSVHIAVIGYRDGRHIHFVSALKNVLYARSAVEKRILRMNVKMYERFHIYCGNLLSYAFKNTVLCSTPKARFSKFRQFP